MARHGWSGTYLLPSTQRECTITLGSLCHGLSVIERSFILIGSEHLPQFSSFPVFVVPSCPSVQGLAPSSPLPIHVGELLFAVPKTVLAPGWTRSALSLSFCRETTPSPHCSGPSLLLVQFCHVFHVLEDQNCVQYFRCIEWVTPDWIEITRFLSLPAVPLIIQSRVYFVFFTAQSSTSLQCI